MISDTSVKFLSKKLKVVDFSPIKKILSHYIRLKTIEKMHFINDLNLKVCLTCLKLENSTKNHS